ncbi:MAG: AAA family ATPase [Fusobacterium mortiferum]|nr:AAA family ATPase [Fusobacterium mortiferum]MDY2801440.1 AAA family ATPase [Fusobacterium mortiferum]MDY4800744.1 AAA family ATPase [Fusobacterium mortiferum]
MEKIIHILNTNNYSINLRSDYTDKEKLNAYYPTFNNMRLLDKFLLSIDNKTNGAIILSGAYGTGKSYLTALLASILGTDLKYKDYDNLLKKAKDIYDISESLKKAKRKKYLIIFIDETKENFSEAVFSGVRKALKEKNINIDIASKIDIIESKLEFWKKNHGTIYNNFHSELEKKNFYHELKYKTKKVEEIFSEVYSNQFGGEKFSYNGEIKNIKELLEDIEKGIEEKGYSGILYIFDEFGRYLETNINKIDVKEIQDMAEYCNLHNSSNILLITHKDIFQYTRKLKNIFERDEWEKVSGRFLKEHLIFEKASVLQIMKNIILKTGYEEYREQNSQIKLKELLLKEIIDENPEECTKDFYPLDYVTALALPDLSQKLAQNERTLFAFICSDDSRSLKSLIYDKENKMSFITLDCLYDYFEREIKQLPVDSLEYKTYIASKDILSKIPLSMEKERRIIKVLAMIYINNNFIEIKPNIETLRYIFNEENLNLDFLEGNKFIVLNKFKNYYKLLEDVNLDIDKKIEEYCKEKIGRFDYIKRLEEELEKEVYFPLKYNDLNKINRYFGQYYVDVSNISRLEELKKNYREDGRIIFLTNIEDNENYHEIEKVLKENQDYILITGADSKLDIYEDLKALEAIALLREEKIFKENETLKIELALYRKEIKDIISKKINQFFNKKINLLEITNDYLNKKYPKYIGVNYELINKRNISIPMRKARFEILMRLNENIELTQDYFNDTRAESSLARVLLNNTGLYSEDTNNSLYLKFSKLMFEILEDIKTGPLSLDELYKKYCSNLGEYGIREGIFTFLLGMIWIKHKEEIVFSFSEGNNEFNFSIDILDSVEKTPSEYKISYYKITEEEVEYLENLEKLVAKNIKIKDLKIYNRVLDGLKNYLLNQPRYSGAIFIPELKGLNKIFKNVFIINNPKEFLLKDLLKIYKVQNYQDLITQLQFEMLKLEEEKNNFIKTLEKISVEILSEGKFESLDNYIKSLNPQNIKLEIEIYLQELNGLPINMILENLTKRIKGFSYENWRTKQDLIDFKELLKKEVVKVKEKKVEKIEYLKLQFGEREELIELGDITDMMEKMLSSKISSTLKNMGFSLTLEQKKKVIAKILLDMKG